MGLQSLKINVAGVNNVAVGSNSGQYNVSGVNNTYLGYNSGPASGDDSYGYSSAIGANSIVTASNQIMLGTTTSIPACFTPSISAGTFIASETPPATSYTVSSTPSVFKLTSDFGSNTITIPDTIINDSVILIVSVSSDSWNITLPNAGTRPGLKMTIIDKMLLSNTITSPSLIFINSTSATGTTTLTTDNTMYNTPYIFQSDGSDWYVL